ncbi:hypothetical protein [Streptomyces ardesiacus]
MPSHHLPLLLTAYQYKFGRDVEAMAQHPISSTTPHPRSWPR